MDFGDLDKPQLDTNVDKSQGSQRRVTMSQEKKSELEKKF